MRRNLFLYLAIACFVAIIAIFIVDGYMGIYDTIYIIAGEREETVEPDVWLRWDRPWSTGVDWGESVHFRYEIDNRRFSSYPTPIQASVWKGNDKLIDLFSEDELIEPFDKVTVEWTLDTKLLEPYQDDMVGYQEYTVRINTDKAERRIILQLFHEEVIPLKPPFIR